MTSALSPAVETARRRLPGLPGPVGTVIRYLRSCVRIDTRSLALFRIAIALLVLGDLVSRSRNFSFYYTDDGVVPQELAEMGTSDHAFSVFFYTSDPSVIAGLFVLHGIVAVVLLVGYKTRLAMILTFLFVISLDHHNPFVTSYADTLFRMLTFWAIFLPLGDRWSIDAVHRDRKPRTYFAGIAAALAMGQMVFMYFINGTNKAPSGLWQRGEAAVLVFGLDEMTFLIGDYMRELVGLVQFGGWLWFTILFVSPLLILLRGRHRVPLLLLFFGGHAAFAVTVRIGAFAYVAMAGLLLFVPTAVWQDGRALTAETRLADMYANLRSRLASAGRRLPPLTLGGDRVRAIRAGAYALVMAVIVVALAISFVLVLPDVSLLWEEDVPDDYHPDERIEESAVGGEIYEMADRFGVTQPAWSIFAGPGPRTTDRYYVFPAETADGEQLDVFNDRELTYERPYDQLQKQHDAYRERFYMNTIRRWGQHIPAQELAAHICETYEAQRGIELTHINMYVVSEQVTVDTIDDPENRDREADLRSRHSCDPDETNRNIQPPEF